MIEKEINKINELYDKIYSEVTKSFEEKHEKLIKEENDMKKVLDNKFTHAKENLEKYLNKSNKALKISEKINNGIKGIKVENNIIIKLNYISIVNKAQKEMKILFKELMKNLNINYNKENNNLELEEYYFSGIPSVKQIKFEDIGFDSCKIKWQIDDDFNQNTNSNPH